MGIGVWNIDVTINKFPQKVASALAKLQETMLGAEYEPIAYLGSQLVNGTNHAVLAEQVVVTGRDTTNVVVIIFNEKSSETEATLVSIERVLETGAPLGGAVVAPSTDIPEDAMKVFNEALEGFVGSNIEPFAYLGSQLVNGINYIFAAEIAPVTPDPEKKVAIITVNSLEKKVHCTDLLSSKYERCLGYAFTWLK